MNITCYENHTELRFGKYKGKTLRSVIENDISYINWCLINLDNFYISDEVLRETITLFHGLNPFCDEANSALKFKDYKYADQLDRLERQAEEEIRRMEEDDSDRYDDRYYFDSREEMQKATFDAMNGGQCGSYYDSSDDYDDGYCF